MLRGHSTAWFARLLLLSLAACADSTTPEPVGGETHFLHACDGTDSCGPGLDCICGVCSKPCLSDNSCKTSSALATCEPAGTPNGACVNPEASPVCDVECNADADCNSLGSGFTCEQGSCRKLGDACILNGVIYAQGAAFMNDCNACTCNNGRAQCTIVGCGDGGMDGGAGSCVIDGVVHPNGDVWNDGCNDCECVDGELGCTARQCDDDAGDSLDCLVGAITYPNGATQIPNPDPESCGACNCVDGNLSCNPVSCTPIALPACHPLHHIEWTDRNFGAVPDSGALVVGRTGTFVRRPSSLSGLSCSNSLPVCGDDTIDAADLNAALLHPDVIEALRTTSSYYPGSIPDGPEITVEVDGRGVRFGMSCSGPSCPVPAGLVALGQLLRSLEVQQHCATPSECALPQDAGACEDFGSPRYSYDPSSGTCSLFQAFCGGFGGNTNNFVSEAACLASCEGTTPP